MILQTTTIRTSMTTELDTKDYTDLSELGKDIRREFHNRSVQEVRVKCGQKNHYVTLENLDGVCICIRIAGAF